MKRITLLYTRSGGGHLSLSVATKEALDRYCKGKYECLLYDPVPAFYADVYKELSTKLQSVWKLGYQATDMDSLTKIIGYLNRLPLANHLKKHVHSFQPDIVISNNPLISTVLPSVLGNTTPAPKRIVHYADPFSIHHLWLTDKTADLYLSPTPEVTSLAQKAGIESTKIKSIGWLTRQKFLSSPPPSAKTRPILGLDQNKFIIFIGGAGQGVGNLTELLRHMVHSSPIRSQCQVVVNTGLNQQLATNVLRIAERYPDFIHVIPYAHNMPYLLSSSDLVIGKAGPNFLFECIHELRPLLAIGCIPGQEEGNLEFITKEQLGWVEPKLSSAIQLIEQLCQNPKLIKEKLPFLKRIKSRHVDTPRRLAWEIDHLK